MARKKNNAVGVDTANQITYSGEVLANSRLFAEDMWLASVVLQPDKYYTQAEARALVDAEKNRKVG